MRQQPCGRFADDEIQAVPFVINENLIRQKIQPQKKSGQKRQRKRRCKRNISIPPQLKFHSGKISALKNV